MTIKKTIKNISLFAGIIFGSLTLSHAAIIPPGTQLATNQNIVRHNNDSEPASIDIHKVKSDVEFDIIHDFFSGLIDTGIDGKLNPDLVVNWETKDNKV
ncbi:hypothetical protein [Photorhabdus sp. CRCIA-P01]|uniref:hypothetical protein n=1 Tax=Photorhabdus sp. CRCIA-P01 TaxID=2019570 RepID=UPI0030D74BCD